MRAGIALLAFAASLAAAQDKPEETLSAVVAIEATALPDARSSATLGARRRGAGALIGGGYVLTIGYLVIESGSIQVTGADGRAVPATLAGYDHASGFGLLKLGAPLAGKPLALGDSAALGEREPALVATTSEREGASIVYVVSRRSFSGSWEYQLDSAIYTYPAVDAWSGAALIGAQGELLGIGSLVVPDAAGLGGQNPGNVFVPVELLKPILADLKKLGRRGGPPRPWLGVNADELRGHLFVARVSPEGPAERAGVQKDDIVLAVGGEEVGTLADFYRKVWARGAAGVDVPIKVLRGMQMKDLSVRSIDRTEYFRASKAH
jgi:S1-C subfamily serine protease